MQIPPIDVILSWPSPNFDNPVTRGDALLVLMVLFSILVLLAVGGRFYSRIVVKNWFGWDDGTMIVATLFILALNIVVIIANRKYGWDRHIWDVSWSLIQTAGIYAFTAKLLFVGAATFTRMSLIFFYYRLVRDSGIAWFSNVLHASMFFVVALGVGFTFLGIFLCVPTQAYWAFPQLEHFKCLDEGTATLIVGILNCVADLLTTVLPIPLVWRLQMPLKHRIGVCILLGLGLVVTIAGALRTYYIWVSFIVSWDITWHSYPLWICAAIEINVAVICACAPALKPLLHQPIRMMTSKLSDKFSFKGSSNPSPDVSRQTLTVSSTAKSSMRNPFRKPSPQDSVWEGDEEYGMLRLEQPDKAVTVHTSACHDDEDSITPWPTRKLSKSGTPGRKPLEIMKRQSVDQEVTYLSQQNSNSSQSDQIRPIETKDF